METTYINILYEDVFQNALISRRTVRFILQHSTLVTATSKMSISKVLLFRKKLVTEC
jgi:ribosomal protein S24E